jgi:hypothetical protein
MENRLEGVRRTFIILHTEHLTKHQYFVCAFSAIELHVIMKVNTVTGKASLHKNEQNRS